MFKEKNENSEAKLDGNITGSGDTVLSKETFHLVIKSPPKASFIRMMHKMVKPFLNEVTWYMVI